MDRDRLGEDDDQHGALGIIDFKRIAGGKPALLPLSEKDGFRLTARVLKRAIGPRTRAVLVNSPCNPTGAVVDPDELLAIARAILKRPRIMVFDEATSSLDSHTEQAIQQTLAEVAEHHTTLAIAHRLSTILHADNIAVLDQGQLIATGTHEELLVSCALYARLANLQFRETDRGGVEEAATGPAVEPGPCAPG